MISEALQIDRTWALFLDRDGVINRRIVGGYVQRWEQFEFLPGVPEAIGKLSDMFGRIIVVSNQQGVGKGLMTAAGVEEIHHRMRESLASQGGRVDAVLFSPHLHQELSLMRKPNVGMALQARRMFPEIRFNKSVMAGDSLTDMVFGKRLGMKTALIGSDLVMARRYHRRIDYIFPDLVTFAVGLPTL